MSAPESTKKILSSKLPSKIARPTKLPNTEKNESSNSILADDPDSFIVGDRVWVGGTKPGIIAFIGETQFGPGDWAGIVLDEPIGKNDGSVAGVRYFQCALNRGIFARPSRLSRSPVDFQHLQNTSYDSQSVSPDSRSISSFSYASSTDGPVNQSRKSLAGAHPSRSDLKLGDRVIIQSSQGSKAGVLRYHGNTEFGSGLWCGVELDEPNGKNDGSVANIRYFECEPKFGLFVPAEKVSRSPISKKNSPSCTVHREGISRQSTLESIRTTSTIQTSASAVKNRRLIAKNSLAQSSTTLTRSPQLNRTTEKDKYIAQLLRERELERAQVTRAATQAEEAEKKLYSLKTEYDRLTIQHEIEKTNWTKTIEALETEKVSLKQQLDEEKRKIEDLVFNYEEESITKSEIQALNEEYVEKLKQFEKVVSSQHASLEYEVNLHTPEKTDEVRENSDAIKHPIDLEKEKTYDEIDFRTLVTLMGEQKKQLLNECQILKDEIEKLKLIDKNKDEVINNLKKEIDNIQPLGILDTNTNSHAPCEECQKLRDSCLKLGAKNDTTEEQVRLLQSQLKQVQEELTEKTALWEQLEANVKHEVDEYKEKNEQMVFLNDQLNVTLSEKEDQLKSNSLIFIKYVKIFSNYLGERNEIINSILFGNESGNNAMDMLRGKDITCSIVFDDDSDANANIVSDFSDYSLQLKDEFLKLKESVDRMINATVASFEKLVTLTEVINRKDELLEEINQEKDTLRREYQEAIESDRKEIDLLKNRYEDLNKIKQTIEKQLEKSEENLRILEELTSKENETVQNEVESIRKELDAKCSAYEQVCLELMNLKEEMNYVKETNAECNELQKRVGSLNDSLETLLKENEKNAVILAEKEKLENEYNLLKMENDNSKNLLEKLQKENEIFTKLLEAKANLEDECERLKQEVDTLKNAINNLKKENETNSSSLQDEIQKCRNERDVVLKQFDQLQHIIKVLKEENEKYAMFSAEKAKSDAKCEALQQEISSIKTILEVSQNENEKTSLLLIEKAESDQKNEALQAEVNNLQNVVERLQKENERNALLSTEKMQSERKCLSLQQEIENCHTAIGLLKQEKETLLQQARTDFDTKRSAFQEEIDKLREACETLQIENEKNVKILTEKSCVENQNESLKRELDFVRNSLKQAQQENEKNLVLVAEKAESDARNRALEIEVSDLKQHVEKLHTGNEQLLSLQEEKSKILAQCETFRQQVEDIHNSLKASQKENEKISNEKAESDAKCSSLQEEVNNLLHSNEKLRMEIENFASSIADKIKLEADLKTLEQESDKLKNILEITQKENETNYSLLCKHADNETKNTALLQEIKDLRISLEKLSQECREKDLILNSNAESLVKCETLQREVDNLRSLLESSQKAAENEKIKSDEKDNPQQQEIVNLQNVVAALQKEAKKNESLLSEKTQLDAKCKAQQQVIDQLESNLVSVQENNEKNALLLAAKVQVESELESTRKEFENLMRIYETTLNENEKNVLLLAQKAQFEANCDALQEEIKLLKSIISNTKNDTQKETSTGDDGTPVNNSVSPQVASISEVDFLNSVIVELQRKIESLTERLHFLEELVPPEKLKPKRIITPRLFCDICDKFDAHDTEDCPIQCNEPEVTRNSVKSKPLHRPYCETCEEFGHDTSECKDDETF